MSHVRFLSCMLNFVMVTSHLNREMWDMFKRVREYELNITTEYILDHDLYTAKGVLMFKVLCSFKIAVF